MNPKNAWPAVVLAGITMIVLGCMAILHVDKDTIALISGGLAFPLLAALLAAQNASTAAKTEAVQQQTNGNTSQLVALVREQGQMIAQMHPPTAGLTAPPAPPEPPPPAEPSP